MRIPLILKLALLPESDVVKPPVTFSVVEEGYDHAIGPENPVALPHDAALVVVSPMVISLGKMMVMILFARIVRATGHVIVNL